MPDYVELKGLNNFSDSQTTELVAPNLVMLFDWGFLDKGAYSNVRLNQSDINNSNRSQLRKVNDPNFSGRVWEAPVKNLVWESGVSQGSVIGISGIYVNNTFVPSNSSGTYAHNIDYPNGRVIFNSAPPANTNVKMEYSYKTIDFKIAEESRIMQFLLNPSFNISSQNFMAGSGEFTTLSPNVITLPHVAFEVSPDIRSRPIELGSFNLYRDTTVLIHCFANTDAYAKKLGDIFMNQSEKTFYMLDIDSLARNGDFPIDYRGYKRANAKTYPQLVDMNSGAYRETTMAVTNSFVSTNGFINYSFKDYIGTNLHHTVVRLTLEIVKTF